MIPVDLDQKTISNLPEESAEGIRAYPFKLDFQAGGSYARLPFIMDGAVLDYQAAGGISCFISSRSAGTKAGEANPGGSLLYGSLGLDPSQVFACTQVHAQEVLFIDGRSPAAGQEGDGMISRETGVWLSVTVADCLPVFLYDTESNGFGIVHSGWKGTGIGLRALRLMERRWHTRPEKVAAILGPCIQACCYRVHQERAMTFEAEFGGSGGAYPLGPVVRHVQTISEKAWYLDLQAANARLLGNAGVRHIAVCQDCTFTDERLGSFRREGASYTRMIALIGKR